MAKIGRNDPCHCGSNLKYKKCCLNKDNTCTLDMSSEGQIQLMSNISKQFGENIVFTTQNQTDIKMSEVIIEFADGILRRAKSEEEEKRAIAIACMAWNLALQHEDKIAELKEDFSEKFSHGDVQLKEDMDDVLTFLIQHKLDYYSHIDRFILNYHISTSGESIRLDIASTIMPLNEDI